MSVGQARSIHKTAEKMKQILRRILARDPKSRNRVVVQKSEADGGTERGEVRQDAVVREANTRLRHGKKKTGFLLSKAVE